MPDINRWVINSACWMGTKDLLLDVTKNYKAHNGGQTDIYRYTIATGEMINLTRTPSDNDYSPDWIDDAALDVSPTAEKLPILWGQLKQTD